MRGGTKATTCNCAPLSHLFLLWEEVVAITKYEKISLIISVASLAIQLIDLLK